MSFSSRESRISVVFKQILCALILYGTGPRRSRIRDASSYGFLLLALDVNSHRAKHVNRSDPRICIRKLLGGIISVEKEHTPMPTKLGHQEVGC